MSSELRTTEGTEVITQAFTNFHFSQYN